MNNHEMVKKLNQTLSYLHERKDYLFNQGQQIKQELETISSKIHEQERYMELEVEKEQQVSNIFSLYDTTNKHAEEKKQIAEKVAVLKVEKEKCEMLADALQKEFERVNETIISNQILVRQLGSRQKQEKSEAGMADTPGKEIKQNDRLLLEVINRLEFCLEILDLDKERCRLELQNVLHELGK